MRFQAISAGRDGLHWPVMVTREFRGIVAGGENSQDLRALIGQPVEWAGMFPSGRALLVKFPAVLLEVESVPMLAGDMGALKITCSTPLPGAEFAEARRMMREPPQLIALRGLCFHGLTGDVFTFGSEYGVRVSQRGIEFVRATPKAPLSTQKAE